MIRVLAKPLLEEGPKRANTQSSNRFMPVRMVPLYQSPSDCRFAGTLLPNLVSLLCKLTVWALVDALIKADKDFDLLVVPGRGHGVGETPYASRRRMDFFVRHLLGVEPRSQP